MQRQAKARALNDEQILEVIDLLQNTSTPMAQIAAKYNCSQSVISNLNRGVSYKLEGFDYPVRPRERPFAKYEPQMTPEEAKASLEETRKKIQESLPNHVEEITNLLETTEMPFKRIAEKTAMSVMTVRQINKGNSYHDENRKYPIREEIDIRERNKQIIEERQSGEKLKDIGKKYNLTISAVSRIVSGSR